MEIAGTQSMILKILGHGGMMPNAASVLKGGLFALKSRRAGSSPTLEPATFPA